MDPVPGDAPLEDERGGRRAVLVLWALVILGLPLAVVGELVRRRDPRVPPAEQPGGPLAGRVVGPDGAPWVDGAVELRVVDLAEQSTPVATARTDADGRFRFDAPAVRGKYELRAGGGELCRTAREHSLVGTGGEPFEIRLRPGALLDVVVLRPDGTAAGKGELVLTGEPKGAALWGLFAPTVRFEGEVREGRGHLDGLPLMRGELRVTMAAGEVLTRQVDLDAGANTVRWELVAR